MTFQDLSITGDTLGTGAEEPGAAIYTVSPLTLDDVDVFGNHETGSTADCCQSVGAITSVDAHTLTDTVVADNSAVADPGASGSGGAGGQAWGGAVVGGSRTSPANWILNRHLL